MPKWLLLTMSVLFLASCSHAKPGIDVESQSILNALQSPKSRVVGLKYQATIIDPPVPIKLVHVRIVDQDRLRQILELIRRAKLLPKEEAPPPHSRPFTFGYFEGEMALETGEVIPFFVMGNLILAGKSERLPLLVPEDVSLEVLLLSWAPKDNEH
ncbi:hypothetical protein [Anatilimnocola floriformis]|uniref:hypothetical protein n=1 Tax=Anatilimnocola floriformis TaxID=2948575 RepID=UPI0020C1C231|nr:hypothetical protein [Anatilimnocola floriformis]